MKNLLISLLCIMFFLAFCSMGTMQNGNADPVNGQVMENLSVSNNMSVGDYRAPSQQPPGGLTPEECPQFIIFGYDDNQYADGMLDVLKIYEGKMNPAGTGQADTFDGAPVSVSFYSFPAKDVGMVDQDVIDSWKLAYQQGHEIGNHTFTHSMGGKTFTEARWLDEMNKGTEYMVKELGIPRNEIIGFRTPYLAYNDNTFTAIKKAGLLYDVSFEGGWRWWPTEDGSTLYWPYTLDEGTPKSDAPAVPKVPGLWEIPDDTIFFPPGVLPNGGTRVTGLDYNMWYGVSLTKAQFLEGLKHSLHKKYYGNRSPMNYGLHSNYYSALYETHMAEKDKALLKATLQERKEALAEFLAYALTFEDVRVVSAKQVLQWLRNPVALGTGPVEKVTVTATSGPNGKLDQEGAIKVTKGGSITFTAVPDADYVVDTVTVDKKPAQMVNNKYTFSGLMLDAEIHVTFKQGVSYTVTATSGVNGKLDQEGAIKVKEGGSISFNAIPDSGYQVDVVTIDNVAQPNPVFPIEFNDVRRDRLIDVTFKIIEDNGLNAVYEISQDWGSGFGGQVTVTNNSTAPISNWEVTWTYPGTEKVTSLWNALYDQTGNKVTVNNMTWNGNLAVGQSVTFGFNGSYTDSNSIPTDIRVTSK